MCVAADRMCYWVSSEVAGACRDVQHVAILVAAAVLITDDVLMMY